MTHHIVVQFSCSIGTTGEPLEYRVIEGSIFNEEYNETLDSGTLVLSQISQELRIGLLKPYVWARVFDKSSIYDPTTGKYEFDKIFLVDNFDEKENNIKEHLYGYSINLMSETKILEKIQCPNVIVTHKLDNNGHVVKKTIYEHIVQYMKLYVPKMKYSSDGQTWEYRPLISYPGIGTEFYNRFNVPCADLPFNLPTLRQLLTILMQQVGCIPIVKNRVLGFLDFQKDAQNFGNGEYSLNDTVNYIRRSLSSDSFANTLVNASEQVIDSGNEVVSETLGFRDKNSVLLKQTENLKLETSFPIFKVNKCILRHPGKFSGYLGSGVGCLNVYGYYDHQEWPEIIYRDNYLSQSSGTKKCTLKFSVLEYSFRSVSDFFKVSLKDNVVRFLGQRSNGSYYVLEETKAFNDVILTEDNTTLETYEWEYDTSYDAYTKSFEILNVPAEAVGFFFSGTFENNNGDTKDFSFIKFAENDPNVSYYEFPGRPDGNPNSEYGPTTISDSAFAAYKLSYATYRRWDISKLVVENSVRQLLERDFVKMTQQIPSRDEASIDKLSKYVYGTVGYSIGSKEISGFSDVFNVGSEGISWIQANYTYIENIINILKYNYDTQEAEYLLCEFFGFLKYMDISYGKWPGSASESFGFEFVNQIERYTFVNLDFAYYSPIDNDFTDNTPFFTACIFDIWYQPLNSFNLAYVKTQEDIDYPLEQLDSGASGLSDFDRLSIHEQEQVDRIGNETLSINQRTNDVSLIQNFNNGPLYFRDDTNRDGVIDSNDKGIDYIIFKRSIAINNNCYNVTYVGSKDAVLKNYFTSIRTKYRAYQYVDYNSSVLRKERDTLFVRVASNIYDGDNKIRLGNLGDKNHNDLSYLDYFIYDFAYETNEKKSICYEIDKSIGKVSDGINGSINEHQTVKNSVSLISNDRMMALIYEYSDNAGAGPYIRDITNNAHLGGIPQHWQIWGTTYDISHNVYFANYIGFYDRPIINPNVSDNDVKEEIMKIERSPIIDSSFEYKTVFWVCDDNTNVDSGRSFYKDYAERINHTVQFIYYAPNKDALFNEHFISATPMIGHHDYPFNACYGSDNFTINSLPHNAPSGDETLPLNRITLRRDSNGIPYIRVLFSGFSCVKMCYKEPETDKIIDIAIFKKDNNSSTKDFYFMINDTKSDYVLTDYHGILYRKYKVKTYESQDINLVAGNNPVSDLMPRTIKKLYSEEE